LGISHAGFTFFAASDSLVAYGVSWWSAAALMRPTNRELRYRKRFVTDFESGTAPPL
jgi:hypothetical protein